MLSCSCSICHNTIFLTEVLNREVPRSTHQISCLKNICLNQHNATLREIQCSISYTARPAQFLICKSCIRSKLDYEFIIYGYRRISYLQVFSSIHNLSLRLCVIVVMLKLMNFVLIIKGKSYPLKVKSNANNPTYISVFNQQFVANFTNKPKLFLRFNYGEPESHSRCHRYIWTGVTLLVEGRLYTDWIMLAPERDETIGWMFPGTDCVSHVHPTSFVGVEQKLSQPTLGELLIFLSPGQCARQCLRWLLDLERPLLSSCYFANYFFYKCSKCYKALQLAKHHNLP